MQSESSKKLVAEIEGMLSSGNYQSSVKLCQLLNERYPNYGHGWFLSSCVALQLNIVQFASYSVDKALSISKENPNWNIQKARCWIKSGELVQAINLTNSIMKIPHLNVDLLNDIAILYTDCHQLERSCEIYKKAIELSPKSSKLYFNLASVERYLGLLESCEKNCNLAIEYDPHNYDAHYMRSYLKLQDLNNNHIQQLYQISKSDIGNPVSYAKIQYALAKELEDCHKFNESFKERKKGANAYRKIFDYNIDSEVQFMRNIAKTYNHKLFKKNKGNENGEGVIFILGLPRTGSTLVERIMGGHTDISSMGELTAFSNIMSEMLMQFVNSNNMPSSEMVSMSSQLDFKKMGEAYMQHISGIKDSSKYFIDKFPQNSLYIGLIHLALPRARIVLVERDPMDSCYSMFKELFTDIYQFSYDLDELAEYYVSHHQLMEHWKNVIPDVINTVKYEELVSNVELTSKNLFNQCKIKWQPQCVDFTKNNQHSRTASASQVRTKIYSSSVGKWKHYEKQLERVSKKIIKYLSLTSP